MSSSFIVPTTSPRLDSCSDQSVQDSSHCVKRNRDDRRMGLNSKRDVSELGSLPPVIQHMSCYAKRASARFKPYLPGRHVPTAVEHRFMTKNVLKRHEADISLVDVQQVY
jgi:hypothetical protein